MANYHFDGPHLSWRKSLWNPSWGNGPAGRSDDIYRDRMHRSERRYVEKVLGLGLCTSVMYVGCMKDMICTSDNTRGCAYVKSVWCSGRGATAASFSCGSLEQYV